MDVGQEVEVHTTFDNSWAPGFEIAEVIDRGCYRVRRKSDGTVLPNVIAEYDLRVAWLASSASRCSRPSPLVGVDRRDSRRVPAVDQQQPVQTGDLQ